MGNQDSKPRAWMKIEEAAAKLEVTPNTVRRYIQAKELRATKVGRGWRVTDEDLQAFLAKRSNIGGRAALGAIA